jgi:hypothetical protein
MNSEGSLGRPMTNLKVRVSILGLAAAALAGSGANATTFSYSRVGFDVSYPGALIENWDAFVSGTLLANGSTVNGITYNSSSGNALVTDAFLSSTFPNGLGETTNGFFLATDAITFSFVSPLTSFGIDINTFANGFCNYTAMTNLGDVSCSLYDPFPGSGTGQFLGFRSTVPFDAVTIHSNFGGFDYTLDTLRYVAAAQPVSEPETLGLFITALIGVSGLRRNRRR